eukprot:365855-Chlamydomonas_euryale.AAC.11
MAPRLSPPPPRSSAPPVRTAPTPTRAALTPSMRRGEAALGLAAALAAGSRSPVPYWRSFPRMMAARAEAR